MAATVYRIKTSRPILWRTPDSLQVGLDQPRIELAELSPGMAPLIHALQEGISREGLFLLARSQRVDEEEVERVLGQLAPACEPDTPAPEPVVGVTGSSRATGHIASLLTSLGMDVRRAANPQELVNQCSSGIALVADYLPHPEWVSMLTRFDVAHTPVIFSDRSISVGPVVRPGSSPCLACLESERKRADPEWLSVGTQLWSETSPLSERRGALMAGHVLCALWGYPRLSDLLPSLNQPGSALRLNPTTGELTRIEATFDPHCRCRGL
jgi:hypothetical protein